MMCSLSTPTPNHATGEQKGHPDEHDASHGGWRRSGVVNLADGEDTGDAETTIVLPAT